MALSPSWRHEEKDMGEPWENQRPTALHRHHSEVMVMGPNKPKAPITSLWSRVLILLRVQHSKGGKCTHVHTHTHHGCYQGKGRIREDGANCLEAVFSNIDQHHQQIQVGVETRVAFNTESLWLWFFPLAWHLFKLVDPLPKREKNGSQKGYPQWARALPHLHVAQEVQQI